ncbi:MAG: hypothetical protein U5K69_16690 [Balneolaceae bacterium]|nr:hypothetical protein [Balneolaceae bacterium]
MERRKDAYLALEFYTQDYDDKENLKLLTTFEEKSDIVSQQNIPMDRIRKQATDLKMDLIEVPLPRDCPNDRYLSNIEKNLKKQENTIKRLVFGDWHLEDIREWREEHFEEMGYECIFPIWEKSLHDLLPVLLLKPVKVKITAVKEEYQHLLKVGELYTQGLVQTLPESIDPMGENGSSTQRLFLKT